MQRAEQAGCISVLLRAWSGGDQSALERLTAILYDKLRRPAQLYTRLVDYGRMRRQSRVHFFAAPAQLMRRIPVEHARRPDPKRGGRYEPVALERGNDANEQLMAVPATRAPMRNKALAGTNGMNGRRKSKAGCVWSSVHTIHTGQDCFYCGLSVEETAEALRVSPVPAMRDWSTATGRTGDEFRTVEADR